MRRHIVPIIIGVLALVVAMLLRFLDPWPVEAARLTVFDSYQRIKPREDPALPVRIIDIGDASLAEHGQWPWPRTTLADLVNRLIDNGAAAIGFAMIFPEPDRTSPVNAVESWPETPMVRLLEESVRSLPDHDEVFANARWGAPVVLGFAAATWAQPREPTFSGGFAFAGSDPTAWLPQLPGGVTSIETIDAAAWGRGALTLGRDVDGQVRRVPLLVALDGAILPSLSVEALRAAQNATTLVTRTADASGSRTFGAAAGLTDVRIGDFTVPTSASGEMWLWFEPPDPSASIEAADVLAAGPAPDPDLAPLVAGHIILIGTSAAGLLDIHATPQGPATPGVVIHAQALEQMISGSFLTRPDWAEGAEIVSLVAIGLPLILILPLVGVLSAAILGAVLAAASMAGSWWAFDSHGLLLDPIYPAIAILLIYMMVSLLVYLRTEQEKGRVRSAFGRYLSPQLVERVAGNPKLLKLGGEARDLTLMFSDIRGFTTIAESMTPSDLTRFINRFLTPMTDAVLAHHGTIDKYMGDAIMAFWNAPLDDPDHAVHACRAALTMRTRLAALNEARRAEAGEGAAPIRIGIGLNTGEAVVGNMGSDQRFDYSVIGDAVNLASRLEGQTKVWGVDIAVGESTRERAGEGFAFLEIDRIRVRGRHHPAHVFALLGDASVAGSQAYRTLAERQAAFLHAYRMRDWAAARDALAACRAADSFGLHGLWDTYEERVSHFGAADPGPDWDGVWVAQTK